MAVYTKDNEKDMVERYASGKWMYNDEEFDSFTDDLNMADTTARSMARVIEGWMVVILVNMGRYDKVDAIWLAEHKDQLVGKFGRGEMLKVVQRVMHMETFNGLEYVEEVEVLQSVWDSYKT